MNRVDKMNDKPMSKSAALKLASSYVGKPMGQGSSWQIILPWDKPGGPTTSMQASSYTQALGKRQRAVVGIALGLMGIADNAGWLDYELSQYNQLGGLKSLFDYVIAVAQEKGLYNDIH